MTEPPVSQIGPYRVVRQIAEGGMGIVYEALHEAIERRVAIKVLHLEYTRQPEALARFFNEARVVNRIEHPSIVQVSEFGEAADGTPYMVMEYLRGESLTSRLERLFRTGQQMPLGQALQIAAQLADALTAAHEKGIVHRDMKPSNVMLVRDSAVPGGERAKILDFGIAKLSQGQAKGTATNVVMGTPQYMSPEQCRGAGGVDDKTDVYALGVMLFEMLAGRTPFLGEGAGEFIGQHMFKEPPPVRSIVQKVPADVAALIDRLLVKDKAARPGMAEVNATLARLLPQFAASIAAQPLPPIDASSSSSAVGPATTLGHSLGQRLRASHPQRGLVLAGALSLSVAAGLSLLALWRPARHAEPPRNRAAVASSAAATGGGTAAASNPSENAATAAPAPVQTSPSPPSPTPPSTAAPVAPIRSKPRTSVKPATTANRAPAARPLSVDKSGTTSKSPAVVKPPASPQHRLRIED